MPAPVDEETQELLTSLDECFAQLRQESGYSQREIAEMAGTNQAQVSYIERGERDLRLSTVMKWASFYGRTLQIGLPEAEGSE